MMKTKDSKSMSDPGDELGVFSYSHKLFFKLAFQFDQKLSVSKCERK